MRIFRLASVVALCALAPWLAPGCKDSDSYRSTVEFHAESVRIGIGFVKREIAREPHDWYEMHAATDGLASALSALPDRVDKQATTKIPERKAAAKKALDLFTQMQPKLNSLKFDSNEMNKGLDELSGLIGVVEK